MNQEVIPDHIDTSFMINETMSPESFHIEAKVFSSNFASLKGAVEKLIRDPYGCFEQASATVYPQVMALQFLQGLEETDDKTEQMKAEMMENLRDGYDRLVSFKTNEDAYEWFGETPSHEALSAYGYLEFSDMAQATDLVDSQMLEELHQWLLSRRDGQGSFKLSE